MSTELPETEQKAYDFIKSHEVVMTKQMPRDLSGAVPNLVRKGLVEVFKRSVSPFSNKKLKYLRLKE